MAKKNRKKRVPSPPRTRKKSDDIREMARDLQDIAESMHRHAAAMDQMGVPHIAPQVGNWTRAVKSLYSFNATQIIARIVAKAGELDAKVDIEIKPRGGKQ